MDTTGPLCNHHNNDAAKQTRWELALCHDAILDIMTRPWVPVDTHSTRVPDWRCCGWLTNAVHTDVTPLHNHHMVAEPSVTQFHTETCSAVHVVHRVEVPRIQDPSPIHRQCGRLSSRALHNSPRCSQCWRRERSTRTELEAFQQ